MEPHIKELIYLKLTVGITEQEQAILDEWKAQSPRNRERYERILEDAHFVERYEQYARIDAEQAFRKFQKRHALSVHKTFSFWKYAAVLLLPLLLMTGVLFYYFSAPDEEKQDETVELRLKSVQSGKNKATLIVPDGKEFELDSKASSSADEKGSEANVYPEESVATDSVGQKKETEESVFTLKTHGDSEYWITLEDGTTVHLNYNTSLAYPVHFSAQHRTVYLRGEAYFYVKEESYRPFRVVTPHGVITEYGTSFNVNTFTPNCTKVVLVDGSISVKPKGGEEQLIVPGDLAVLQASSAKAEVEKVDVEPYIAWNKGRFVFDNCSLGELMEVISNWYGVKVEFACESCRQMRFTGDMNRYGSLPSMLQAIREATSLDVELDEKTIIIK